jgi:hypothetical protein
LLRSHEFPKAALILQDEGYLPVPRSIPPSAPYRTAILLQKAGLSEIDHFLSGNLLANLLV